MKFLSEFRSCYGTGGLIVAEAEDTTADTLPQQQPLVVTLNHASRINHAVPASRTATANRERLKKVQSSSAGNWKPVLSVIFENSVVVSDVVSKQMSIRSDKKKSSVKPKSTVKSSSYGGGDVDYRKSIHPMALPAFSPTPFLF